MGLQPSFRRSVLLVLVLVTLSFGWWPYNFISRNDVLLLPEQGALSFNSSFESGKRSVRGIALGDEVLDTRDWQGITIVLEMRGRHSKGGLGVFLELFDDQDVLAAVLLAQWQDHLAIRSRRDRDAVSRGYSEIGHRDIFKGPEFVELLVASEGNRTHVYVNGEIVESRVDFPLVGADNKFSGSLLVGNSADGTRPFSGEIRSLKIYDSFYSAGSSSLEADDPVVGFDYSAGSWSEGIIIPDRFTILKNRFFSGKQLADLSKEEYKRDILINILGFIPVGVCFAAVGRRRFRSFVKVALFVGVASFSLSMLIEWGQGYLAHRDSSQLDVLLNTISGMIAVIVPRRWILFL